MSDKISDRPSVRIVAGPAGRDAHRFWGMTARRRLERALTRAQAPVAADGPVLSRDDLIFDEMLSPALLRTPGVVLTDAEGAPVAVHLLAATGSAAVEA